MKKVIALISILGIFATLVGPSLAAEPGPATAQESADHWVFLPLVARNSTLSEATTIVRMFKAAYLQVAQLIQPLQLIDYDSFVWLELDAANLAILSNSGVEFELQQEANLLFLNRFQFDPLEGEPQIPPKERTAYEPGEDGFHLVQFFGPTRDEWLDGLRATGAIVIQFQPSHAYIVRMTPEEAALVDEQDFVRWVGVYHAAYRIAPSLLVPPGPDAPQQQIIENVDVTIYNTGQVTQTIAAIIDLGGELIQQFPVRSDGSLVTAIFALPSNAVVDVAQLNAVLWMNFRPPVDEPEDEMSSQIIAGNINPLGPGYQAWLTANGVNGAGVTVALVDTGYDTGTNATAHPDLRGRLIPVGTPTDTNGHGTHVGGIIAGNASLGTTDATGYLFGLGVAPNANMVVIVNTGADANRTRNSVINGAVASNNSYLLNSAGSGYSARDSTYDSLVRDADQTTTTVAEPLVIVFSTGNSGTSGPTKEAKNIIAVGNSLNQRTAAGVPVAGVGNINTMAATSSRGPAQDQRTYPHVTAPGTNIISTRSTQTGLILCTTIPTGAPAANPTYAMCSGTSMAAPHVTGAVALITQWWRNFNAGANPSPAMAKALLINGAVDMGVADIPNNNEGWGRVNLNNVINPGVPVIYQDQATTFSATSQSVSLQVRPANLTQPLKVTLVWSDAPGAGSGGTTAAWVNDLDLTVLQGATTFRGNAFASGFSTPGGVADTRNNVENVYLQNPSGVYNVTVNAANIAGDGVPYNGDATDQDFALVCFNCALAPDLVVTKSDSPDPVIGGQNLTYNLSVTNNGPVAATGAMLTDTLPAGTTFVSASPSQGTCSNPAPGTITCSLGALANGANATVAIIVTVNSSTSCGATLTNTAEVTSNEPDPTSSNNIASADTSVICQTDLSIIKSDSPDPVYTGTHLTYALSVSNHGPSDATGVTVIDNLPTGVAFVSATTSQGTCMQASGTVTCNLGNLASGATATVTIVVTPTTGGTITNTANVAGNETDPNLTNNSASASTTVVLVVPIDIKPGSDPNSINLKSKDVIPVAILTTPTFDATTVDPLSVRFGPGGASEAHNRGHIEDVDSDGDIDLVLHFAVSQTGIASSDTQACLTGMTSSGLNIIGCDAIRIVPP